MSKREKFHVVYEDKQWKVKKEKARRASSIHPTKNEAIKRGTELAKETGLGQLIIHKKDGRIQKEYTYGKDPERYPS